MARLTRRKLLCTHPRRGGRRRRPARRDPALARRRLDRGRGHDRRTTPTRATTARPRLVPRHGRQRPQRLRPARDPPRLRPREDDRAARRPHAARVRAQGHAEGHRGRARRHVRRLGLQRPHPRPDAARRRGRPRPGEVHATRRPTRTRSTSTACTRRAWTASRATAPATSCPAAATVYEFDAEPFGLHLYHCHVRPLAEHIGKGLYGAFIIDPKQGREPADEMVMVMHGLDTNFDGENEIYAVNGIGFAYMDPPVRVKRNELVRIHLVNVTEFDPINSFHVHGNFFHYFPTGTSLQPVELTDTVMQCQGQRGILELQLPARRALHVPRPPVRVHRARLAGLLRGRGLTRMAASATTDRTGRAPVWLLGLVPLLLIVAALDRLRPARRPRPDRAQRRPDRGGLGRAHGPQAGDDRDDDPQRRARRGQDRAGAGQRRLRPLQPAPRRRSAG